MNGPIKTIYDGSFGEKIVDFDWGQWFRVKRANAEGLNLHGEDPQHTIIIWLQRESDCVLHYFAGIWSEGDKQFLSKAKGKGARAPARQYTMFLQLARASRSLPTPCFRQDCYCSYLGLPTVNGMSRRFNSNFYKGKLA